MVNGMLGLYKSIIDRVLNFILYISIIFLSLMMFLTVSDVLLRYVFNRPISGATELIELMMAVFVPFSILYCAKRNSHICVELVVEKFSRKSQIFIELMTTSITIAFFALMAWQNYHYVFEEFESKLTTSVLLIPTYPFVAPVAIMSGFICLVLLGQLLRHISEAYKK